MPVAMAVPAAQYHPTRAGDTTGQAKVRGGAGGLPPPAGRRPAATRRQATYQPAARERTESNGGGPCGIDRFRPAARGMPPTSAQGAGAAWGWGAAEPQVAAPRAIPGAPPGQGTG